MLLFGGFIASYLALVFIWWLLQIIANWLIFKKAGEAGWKSIIPIYADYITYRIAWKKSWMFWVWLIGMFLMIYAGSGYDAGAEPGAATSLFGTLGALAAFVSYAMMNLKKSAAFGHGVLFGIGMLIFPPIFTLILGFGASPYYGPQD